MCAVYACVYIDMTTAIIIIIIINPHVCAPHRNFGRVDVRLSACLASGHLRLYMYMSAFTVEKQQSGCVETDRLAHGF